MGSRRVVQFGGFIMIIFAVIGKFGAIFVTIPDPVIGGVFCCVFGLITAVGISNLQYVDLNSVRNLFIVGFSIIMAMVIPNYMENNPGVIDTGKLAGLLVMEYKYRMFKHFICCHFNLYFVLTFLSRYLHSFL